MWIRPIGNHILIRKSEPDLKGGLVLPDGAEAGRLAEAEILAVGLNIEFSNGRFRPFHVKQGDQVYVDNQCDMSWIRGVEGEDRLWVCGEEAILGVREKAPPVVDDQPISAFRVPDPEELVA